MSHDFPVLFRFCSPFHLLGGLAFLDHLRGAGVPCNAYASHRSFWRGSRIDPAYISMLASFGVRQVEDAEFEDLRRTCRVDQSSYYELFVNHAFELPWRSRSAAVIDDGTGAYLSGYLDQMRVLAREMTHSSDGSAWSAARSYAMYVATRLLEGFFPPSYKFGLLQRNVRNGEREVNEPVRESMLNVLCRFRQLRGSPPDEFPSDRPVVVFASQPLVRLGLVREERYRRLMGELGDWARRDLGATMCITRHPADDFDYGSCPVSTFPGMTEELLLGLGDRVTAVLSMGSTVNYTANVLFGLKTYFCPTWLLAEDPRPPSGREKRSLEFFRQFSETLDPRHLA